MSASLLSGTEIAALKKENLKKRVQHHVQQGHRPPGLAVILVGPDPASSIYVKNKRKACEEVGINSFSYDLSETTTQNELNDLIHNLNQNELVDGILIQLPLPSSIDSNFIIEQIDPKKDVDGFHPYNLGRLVQKNPLLRPCTPLGIMNLLDHYQLAVQGKQAVVIGASNIVGRPMSLELLAAGATVTVCHRQTLNLKNHVMQADIIVVATGVLDVISVDWLQPHQIVIDVGIHRLSNGSLRGDVDFEKAKDKVAWISPVPGGVGPMTIVSLLENTLAAAGVA